MGEGGFRAALFVSKACISVFGRCGGPCADETCA